MERFGRGPQLVALLATLAVTCAVAHAQSDAPPARTAHLGLAIKQLSESWRESNAYRKSGLMVVGVDPSGRAAKSGIVAGDVLVSVGGRTMREPSDLGDAERSLSPDQTVSVVAAREGGRLVKTFEIAPVGAAPAVAVGPATVSAAADTAAVPATSSTSVLGPEQAAGQKAASDVAPSLTATGTGGSEADLGTGASGSGAGAAPVAIGAVGVASAVVGSGASSAPTSATVDSGGTPPDSVETHAELGVVGKSLTPDLASALGASGVEGLLVLEVAAASPADRSGLRAGDIIVKVGEQPVADMGELQRAAAASSMPIRISTLRLGKPEKVEIAALDGPPPTPSAPPSQEQLMMELRDEVRSLRREVQALRKKLGK